MALAALLTTASACSDSAADLPASITVLGQGEASAEPDGVNLSLSISTADPFGFGMSSAAVEVPAPVGGAGGAPAIPEFEFTPPQFEIVTEEKLQPVVQALADHGVTDENISVNPFRSSGPFGVDFPGASSVEVVVSRARPSQVEPLLNAVQQALSDQGQYSLRSFRAVFTVADCSPLEDQARQQALANARSRAEELAKDAGVKLGTVATISEIPIPAPFFFGASGGGAGGGCGALEDAAEQGFPGELFGFATSPSMVKVSVGLQVTYRLEE